MKCIYLGYNPHGANYVGTYGCTNTNHPGYSKENGWHYFGRAYNVPEVCHENCSMCPLLQQAGYNNSPNGNRF